MKNNEKKIQTRDKLLNAAFEEVYIKGYHGSSTSVILKNAKTPKGSMYHFFPSKKDLVLAVIKERIFPKMDSFFNFTYERDKSVVAIIENIFIKISQNEMLIKNSCPMHKLIVEMSPLDEDFNKILNEHFEKFLKELSQLLEIGIEKKEFNNFDSKEMSTFILLSTWGILSISPSMSSKEKFEKNYNLILDIVKSKIN